ncbi:sugar phosphate isomerase/epimerase family protein [Actinokineospora soli]|uniref:Sugar phosphate isomerase/epimerase family protein n=1 Tax=Actinokineospora soli TaxID=1048753 RepID=A0ABW2TRM8_9PSEU
MSGLARFALNQRTTARWSVADAVAGCVAAGVPAIGLWREPVADAGLDVAARLVADAGLRVSSLCRGGFFTGGASHGDNVAALDEAVALGTDVLVLVPGGLPVGDKDIAGARARIADGVAALVDPARERGVRLAIEPMHPMFAADRGAVSTLAQALDIACDHDPDVVGVVVDTFHVWWDPDVLAQIARAAGRILSYQVSDWITPLPADALLSRGLPGDGHIDFAALTRAVAAAGYAGDVEVEVFNAEVWERPPADVLADAARRHLDLVAPHL